MKDNQFEYPSRIDLLIFISRPGHYNRALDEAVQTHKAQWARDWESKNPLSGGSTFTTMTPAQRVRFSIYYTLL